MPHTRTSLNYVWGVKMSTERAKFPIFMSCLQPWFHFLTLTGSFAKAAAGRFSPGNLLLQLGDGRHVKHHSEVHGRFQCVFIQLLLQGFLQIHPPALILLVVVPEAEVSDLERRKVTDGGSKYRGIWGLQLR